MRKGSHSYSTGGVFEDASVTHSHEAAFYGLFDGYPDIGWPAVTDSTLAFKQDSRAKSRLLVSRRGPHVAGTYPHGETIFGTRNSVQAGTVEAHKTIVLSCGRAARTLDSRMDKLRFALVCAITFIHVTLHGQGFTNGLLALNGVSSYVSVPSSPQLQNSNELTVETWVFPVRLTNHDGGQVLGKSDGQSGDSQRTYELKWRTNGTIIFAVYFALPKPVGQPSFAEIMAPVPENTWTHVVGTYSTNSGGLRIYIDGMLSAASTSYDGNSFLGAKIRQTTLPLLFGGSFVSGSMDEVRVWNRARTANEIASSRFCRLTGLETNLAGYWQFDDGTARDVTGHGNDGAFFGGATTTLVPGVDAVHNGICGAGYVGKNSLILLNSMGFHQTIYGHLGTSLTVEASTNLINWSPILILPNFSGELEFTDPSALNHKRRFYRFVLP
jgi:hypothetical protein